jgi:hypothetical protein
VTWTGAMPWSARCALPARTAATSAPTSSRGSHAACTPDGGDGGVRGRRRPHDGSTWGHWLWQRRQELGWAPDVRCLLP